MTDEPTDDPQLPDLPPDDEEARDKSDQQVVEQMTAQHPIHAMMGRVYRRLGGEEFVLEWAQMYPGQFMKLFVGMTPGMAPMSPFQGDVHLHVHPALGPTPLDDIPGEAEEVSDSE